MTDEGTSNGYLLAAGADERARLRLQSEVWEPDGKAVLAHLGDGSGSRAVEVGCGPMGWLRLLSEWVGPGGTVVGTDADPRMTDAARELVNEQHLDNVSLVVDDLFATDLQPASFDLLHSRFEMTPLGRPNEQMATYLKLLRPGGWLVLEECDASSWRFHPDAPAAQELIHAVVRAFAAAGGDMTMGLRLNQLMRERGLEPELDAAVHALRPGHPYLRVVLAFAASLQQRLTADLGEDAVTNLIERATRELDDPQRWGMTFTVVQAWARVAGVR